MAGLANLFYIGQPDPEQQIARLLSGQLQPGQQPSQGPAPPSAASPPAGGAGADPNAQAAPAPPAPGNLPPNSGPQPSALQSSPDMAASYCQLANPPNIMTLMVQMDQRDRAMQGINSAFAQIAANHSPPSMRAAIMQNANAGAGDPSAIMGNLMGLYQNQQQMGAMQSLLAQSPQIAQKLGMDEGVVRAEILAGRGSELIRSLEPTPEIRDITAKHDMFIKNAIAQGQDPTAAEATWQRDYFPFMISGGAGGGDATTQSWRTNQIMWNRDHPGEPFPWGDNTPTAFANWNAQQVELRKDQEDARNKLHSGYEQNITDLRGNLGNIIGLKPGGDPNNPDDYDQAKQGVLKSALSKPGAQAYLSGDPRDFTTQALGAALQPEEKAVLDQIRSVSDKGQLFGTLNARAPKRGVSDINAIGAGLGEMQNVRTPFDRYLQGAQKTISAADQGLGNGYGAAGEAENAPDYTKPLINDAYLPGGSMYPFGKKQLPMSQDQIAQATAKIKAAQDPENERQLLIKVARANNIDTKPLQSLRF